MTENELIKKIAISRAKPKEFADLQPGELADLILIVLDYIKKISKAIEDGKIKGDKGDSPIPDVDYLSLPTAKAELEDLQERVISKILSDAQNALSKLRNGKDGRDGKDGKNAFVTEAQIKEAAKLAFEMIQLPDFRVLITEQPEAIRDSLELLQDDERLDVSAIKGLEELLKKYEGKGEMMVGGIRFMSQLADVRITSIANNDVLKWNSTTLLWENGAVSGGISDGDKGDITVSGSGATWTIDNLAVTDAKINDVAWSKVTGEPTTLAGYGISDTKANFDSALSDGNFLYVGDITQYTDEMAQDAVGGMVNSTLTYTDGTPELGINLSSANTWLADQSVPDEAYGAGWNGSMEVPTKNALYDKIETLGGGSGITRTVVTTSGSLTLGATASTDYTYYVAGAHTLSMPSPNANRYTVKNLHSAAITIDTAGAENIEGAASLSLQPNDSVDIMSDGTNWYIH